jgi:hypothetical protein
MPKGSTMEFNVGQATNEGLDFRIMFDIWDRDMSHKPTDLDKIGTIVVEMLQYTWSSATGPFEERTPIRTHVCSMDDVALFPPDLSRYVSETFVSDYHCIDDDQSF